LSVGFNNLKTQYYVRLEDYSTLETIEGKVENVILFAKGLTADKYLVRMSAQKHGITYRKAFLSINKYSSIQLEDKTFEEYGIENESTLHLNHLLSGGLNIGLKKGFKRDINGKLIPERTESSVLAINTNKN
jgi:hypothetical protein